MPANAVQLVQVLLERKEELGWVRGQQLDQLEAHAWPSGQWPGRSELGVRLGVRMHDFSAFVMS